MVVSPGSPPASPRLEARLRPLGQATEDTLMVHEIYASIQGESTWAGEPCTFIRTTACHLRCTYCDTPHAFTEGKAVSTDEILQAVQTLGIPTVEITGGEPLLQPGVPPLCKRLCDEGFRVLLETSGSLDIRTVDPRVIRIVDFKTPGSGEEGANLYGNIEALTPHDEVKLVLCGEEDYRWAVNLLRTHDLAKRCTVLLGPVFGRLAPSELAAWIVRDRIPVRMQIQMHKSIWAPEARGV